MSNPENCFAVDESNSRGRAFKEAKHRYRADFERDRDRIIHSSAFRRLEGKTQVFTPGLDDYYRTRLTHSIEVAQIGRTIAKALSLNETLTEAICLAHDLGHAPFGHAGEEALNKLMAGFGGFEHNCQSLRIVELLEHPYPDFAGLNLMYETRLALAKHKSTYDKPGESVFAEQNCSLEGQVADIADRIAYNCHDLEDGLKAKVLSKDKLLEVDIFADAQKKINASKINDRTIERTRTAKAVIDMLVSDCIKSSSERIAKADIKSVEDIYANSDNLIVLSESFESALVVLEKCLYDNFYMHESVMRTTREVGGWLKEIFEKISNEPDLMPRYFKSFIKVHGLARAVCDYIAGMTDRFCLKMLE